MNKSDTLEFISAQSELLTEQTKAGLAQLRLDELLRTKSTFWFHSQQGRGYVSDLIEKLIDEKLTNEDEAFARQIFSKMMGMGTTEAIQHLAVCTKVRRSEIKTVSAHAENRLIRDFIARFCNESFGIDWIAVSREIA